MDEDRAESGSLGHGVLVAAGVNLVALVISVASIALGVGVVLTAGFGLLQVLWLAPFYIKYRRKGASSTCKGIALGAGITLLLSAACWANLNLSGMH